MEKPKVRNASPTDYPAIFKLVRELAVYEKAGGEVDIKAADLKKHASQGDFNCLVAEVGDVIAGMALFYPRFSTWKGATLHLEDLMVSEKYRKQGVGTALYRAFLKAADDRGVSRVEWVVLDWNRPATEFYKKSGAQVLTDWNTVQMDRSAYKKFLADG